MLHRVLASAFDRYKADDVATYFLCVASIALAIALLFIFAGGDGDGGTGPKPEQPPQPPAPGTVPDRPPAEWFSEFAKR